MKNEIKGFIFFILSVICFCTHEICDKLFWISAYLNTERPTTGSWTYGGIILILLAILFLALSLLFFLKSKKD